MRLHGKFPARTPGTQQVVNKCFLQLLPFPVLVLLGLLFHSHERPVFKAKRSWHRVNTL